MTWIFFAGLTAFLESLKDVASKRGLKKLDAYLVSWSLFALMVPVWVGYYLFDAIPPLSPPFFQALIVGSFLNAIAVLFYVRAIQISDLSLTVPIVALTPLFLLLIAPWLVGEYPVPMDVVGVFLIVGGAYVLNLRPQVAGYLAPLKALLTEPGPRLMLLVAAIWSFTSSFDKIGVLNSSPSFWVVSLFSVDAILLTPILFLRTPRTLQSLTQNLPILLLIGGLSCVTVLVQMQAIQIAPVTRVIAVKRTSTLMGVLWGYLIFREQGIRQRAIGSLLMILGVFLISKL
jgi:drug/metabolite transporter (DMT)-like permease